MAITDILFNVGESSSFIISAGSPFSPLYAEGSVYQRPTGIVVADAGNSSIQFKTNLPSLVNNSYKDSMLIFITGGLKDQVRSKISSYDASTKIVVMSSAFTGVPSVGDKFIILGF